MDDRYNLGTRSDQYVCEIVDTNSRKIKFQNIDEQIRLELKVNKWYDDYGLSKIQCTKIGDYLYYSNRNIYKAPEQPKILEVTSEDFDALLKLQSEHLLTPFEQMQKDVLEYKKKICKNILNKLRMFGIFVKLLLFVQLKPPLESKEKERYRFVQHYLTLSDNKENYFKNKMKFKGGRLYLEANKHFHNNFFEKNNH